MKIHQLLHGYGDGHGRLAGSLMDLTPKDAARIAQMSDWSGYRDPTGKDHSYLTAYPLEDSGLYVVAKSWYASEMERPGCVWTHSLLIDIGQKSDFVDFRVLKSYFRRPTRGEYGKYNKPLEIDNQVAVEWTGFRPDEVSMSFMLSTLLAGEDAFSLKVEQDSEWNQQLCLVFLQTLPLGMLKRVSLSSGSPTPRKMGNELLSMQFITMQGGISLLTPPWKDGLDRSDFSSSLIFIVNGMMGESSDVSGLIKVFSDDIGESQEKYVGVALLLEMLHQKVTDEALVSYSDVLGTIVNFFPALDEGNVVKVNYLRERISSLFCKSEQEFIYIIATWCEAEKHFTAQQMNLWSRIAMIAEIDEVGYKDLLEHLVMDDVNAFGHRIVAEGFDHFEVENNQKVPDALWEKLLPYLKENEQYLTSERWLELQGSRFNDVLWIFQSVNVPDYQHWKDLLTAIMQKQAYVEDTFVDKLYENVPNCAFLVLDFLNCMEKESRNGYLYTKAFRSRVTFIEWLSLQQRVSACVGDMTIAYVDPNSAEVRQSAPEFWHWLITNDDGRKHIDYYIYVLALAYHWQGHDAQDFFFHSFARVHDALGESQTSDYVWRYVSCYSGKVYFFQEWDRCRKLRNGVVAHLKSLGFDKSVLRDFTPDRGLNETLVGIWEKN